MRVSYSNISEWRIMIAHAVLLAGLRTCFGLTQPPSQYQIFSLNKDYLRSMRALLIRIIHSELECALIPLSKANY